LTKLLQKVRYHVFVETQCTTCIQYLAMTTTKQLPDICFLKTIPVQKYWWYESDKITFIDRIQHPQHRSTDCDIQIQQVVKV